MKKKFLSLLLSAILLSLSITPAFSAYIADDSVVTTSYILVENGVPRQISAEEYYSLLHTPVQSTIYNTQETSTTALPAYNYYYVFEGTSESLAFHPSLESRVSNIYSNISSLTVTASMTYTRTITNSAGLSITSDIQSAIDSKVNLAYSRSTSATSSQSSSITGVFTPSGAYTYSCVTFIPRLSTVTGTLSLYQSVDGIVSRVSYTPGVQAMYPVSVSGYLDGIYQLRESNNYNSLTF